MLCFNNTTSAGKRTWNRSRVGLAVILAGVLAAGCTVGPDYQPPKPGEVQADWVGTATQPATTQPSTTSSKPADLAHWWTIFHDEELNSLIERAIAANLDLRQAESRLRQARAARGVVSSSQGPEVDAVGSYQYSKSSTIPGIGQSYRSPRQELYQAGFDATWELDVFGSVRRNVEAADASIDYAAFDQRDTLVTVIAEVAVDYANLRGYQRQIVIARDNMQAELHSADVTRQKFHGGLVGKLDVADADALAATTKSQIPVLQAQAQQTIYAIGILLDRPPTALLKELSSDAPIPVVPPAVPVGLPSELLRRRPDIRRAEAAVHAATAQIGVATAELFPQFTLTGSLTLQASSLQNAFTGPSPSWGLGPGMTWPIFTSDRIQSNIKVQNELQVQALLTYRQTVLTALSDVESALIAYLREQEHRDALRDAVAANIEAVNVSNLLYVNGNTDFLNVLTAEAALYSSQNALVQSNNALATDLIAIYKALGGGWEGEAKGLDATTQPAQTQPANGK